MKSTILSTLMVLLASTLMAQPSDATIKSDLKKDFPKATEIILLGSGNVAKEYENNSYQTVYRRDVTITVPADNPKYPGVKWLFYGGVRYNSTGSNFVYGRYNPGNEELIGMPDPDKVEILTFVKNNLNEIFRLAIRNEIIGTPSDFEITADNKFIWHNFNSFSFKAHTTYERFINDIGDAEKVSQVYELRMYREDENKSWDRLNASEVGDTKKVLSTRKYTQIERETMKSFELIQLTAAAEKKWANMKPITFPEMKDIYDVKDFIHAYFLTADKEEIESLLYQMLASGYFVKPDFKVLTSEGGALISKTLQATVTGEFLYKNQFCTNPELKEAGNGFIDYWNKDKSAYTRLEIGKENNTWKITGVTIYVNSILDKAKIIEATPCGSGVLSAVSRGERQGVSGLKVKDVVLAYYDSDGLWYPAFYLGYSSSYYDIQYFMGNSKSKVRTVVPYTPTVGDIAYVKTQSGQLVEVTILSINQYDVEIDFNGTKTAYKLSGLYFKK